jgi:anti-sigma regulatory factor (Ser/Thr protein kinase)
MGIESRPSHLGALSETTHPDATSTRSPSGVRAEVHLRAGSVAGLRSLRTGLGHCLEQGECGPDLIADAQLVLAEIATNAFIHDTAPLVDVQVTCGDDEITITTWHRGDAVPPSYPVQPVSSDGPVVTPGGRGLAIVDRLVTGRDVASESGCTTTVVRFRR